MSKLKQTPDRRRSYPNAREEQSGYRFSWNRHSAANSLRSDRWREKERAYSCTFVSGVCFLSPTHQPRLLSADFQLCHSLNRWSALFSPRTHCSQLTHQFSIAIITICLVCVCDVVFWHTRCPCMAANKRRSAFSCKFIKFNRWRDHFNCLFHSSCSRFILVSCLICSLEFWRKYVCRR